MAWLERAAARCGLTYDAMMDDAASFNETGDVIVQRDSQIWRDNFPDATEFWKHWEIVTGLKPNHAEAGIYCCTC